MWREELKERRSSLLEEATIFQVDCWRYFSEQEGEDCIYYFVCTEPKKSTACVFILLYGCFIYCTAREVYGLFISAVRCIKLAQISRGVRPVLYCCTVHLIFAQISRKVRLGFFLYELLIYCWYGLLVRTAVRSAVRPDFWQCFRGRCTACWCCTFASDFAQKTKKGVGWFAEHKFSRLCEEVCRWR